MHICYYIVIHFILYYLAPKGLKLVEVNLKSITVVWQPIPNGSPSGYRIRYSKSGSGDYDSLDVKSDQTQAEITNLEENTEYEIRVTGLFRDGKSEGSYTDKIEAKTLTQSGKSTLKTNFFQLKIQCTVEPQLSRPQLHRFYDYLELLLRSLFL